MKNYDNYILEASNIANELFKIGKEKRLSELKALDKNSDRAKKLIKEQKKSDRSKMLFNDAINLAVIMTKKSKFILFMFKLKRWINAIYLKLIKKH